MKMNIIVGELLILLMDTFNQLPYAFNKIGFRSVGIQNKTFQFCFIHDHIILRTDVQINRICREPRRFPRNCRKSCIHHRHQDIH